MPLRAAIAAACALLTSVAAAQTPSFSLMGLPSVTVESAAAALSADGTKAAGYGLNSTATHVPGFTWTRAGGRDDFGNLPGMPPVSVANAISSDGATIAGYTTSTNYFSSLPYRRTGSGPLQTLGTISSYTRGFGTGISGDGSVVVGWCERGPTEQFDGQAFRWTAAGGMQGLGFLPNGNLYSEAKAVSRDGSTIVGISKDASSNYQGFRWTAGTGMQALPRLPGVTTISTYVRATNLDGSVTVGDTDNQTGLHVAARWSGGGVMELGTIQDFPTTLARGVSDAGDVIVGLATNSPAQNPIAFVWTPSSGMMPLPEYLMANGVTLPMGWRLTDCLSVSGDGRSFAGLANLGLQRQGFVATIPAPCTLLVLSLPFLCGPRPRRGAPSI